MVQTIITKEHNGTIKVESLPNTEANKRTGKL
jgi:hypothetical protein